MRVIEKPKKKVTLRLTPWPTLTFFPFVCWHCGGLPGAGTYVISSLNHAGCVITTSGVFFPPSFHVFSCSRKVCLLSSASECFHHMRVIEGPEKEATLRLPATCQLVVPVSVSNFHHMRVIEGPKKEATLRLPATCQLVLPVSVVPISTICVWIERPKKEATLRLSASFRLVVPVSNSAIRLSRSRMSTGSEDHSRRTVIENKEVVAC